MSARPPYRFDCESGDGSRGSVQVARKLATGTNIVALVALDENRSQSVLIGLPAAEARKLGAELLNIADEIEDRVPLVFFPPNAPTATYPPGHPSA